MPEPVSIDWTAVATGVVAFLTGVGAVLAALAKRLRAPQAPAPTQPAPTNGAALLPAVLAALQRTAEGITSAEEAVRSVQDAAADTQASLGSQLGAMRDLLDELRQHELKLARLVAKGSAGR